MRSFVKCQKDYLSRARSKTPADITKQGVTDDVKAILPQGDNSRLIISPASCRRVVHQAQMGFKPLWFLPIR
jgi:hypothetical protein